MQKQKIAELNDQLCKKVAERNQFLQGSSESYISTAKGYVQTVLECTTGLCPVNIQERTETLKAASKKLIYKNPDMRILTKQDDASIESSKLTPGSIFDCNIIATSKKEDRDGDVLHPDGAIVDPYLPFLWQHNPVQPIGKMVALLSQDAKTIKMHMAIADTVLGRDAAILAEFGALRISQGFRPIEFSERSKSKKDQTGFEVKKYEMLEVSLVSVPSNTDAVILDSWAKGKFQSDELKFWGHKLYRSRPLIVKGGIGPDAASDNGDSGMEIDQVLTTAAESIRHSGGSGQLFYRQSADGIHVFWVQSAKDVDPQAVDETGQPYTSADDIKGIFGGVAGVSAVTVATELQPQMNTGWACAYPPDMAGPWGDDSVESPTEGNDPVEDQKPTGGKPDNPVGATQGPTDKPPVDAAKPDPKPPGPGTAPAGDTKPPVDADDPRQTSKPKPTPPAGNTDSKPPVAPAAGDKPTAPANPPAKPAPGSDHEEPDGDEDEEEEDQDGDGDGKPTKPKKGSTEKCNCKKPPRIPDNLRRATTFAGKNYEVEMDGKKHLLAVGSADYIASKIGRMAGAFLDNAGIYVGYSNVKVVAVFPDHVVVGVGVYDYYYSDREEECASYYQVAYTINPQGEPELSGDPIAVNLTITFTEPGTAVSVPTLSKPKDAAGDKPADKPAQATTVGSPSTTPPSNPAPAAKPAGPSLHPPGFGKSGVLTVKSWFVPTQSVVSTKKMSRKSKNSLKEAAENLDEAIKAEDLRTPVKTLVLRGSQLIKEVMDEDDKSKVDPVTPSDDVTGAKPGDDPKDYAGEVPKSWDSETINSWKSLMTIHQKMVKSSGSSLAVSMILKEYARRANEFCEKIESDEKSQQIGDLLKRLGSGS